jgi:hypothetical protein
LPPEERQFDLVPALIMLRFEKIREPERKVTTAAPEDQPSANNETPGDTQDKPSSKRASTKSTNEQI